MRSFWSADRPPPETIQWMCGWKFSVCPKCAEPEWCRVLLRDTSYLLKVQEVFQRSICVTENTEVPDYHKSKDSVMRNGKHYMKIRWINDFRTSLVNPDFFQDCLTVGQFRLRQELLWNSMWPQSVHWLMLQPRLPDLQFSMAVAAFSCTPDIWETEERKSS